MPLKGSEHSPETEGSLFLNVKEQKAFLMVTNLLPPSTAEVYQVWVWEPGTGTLTTVGTFITLIDGYGMWTFPQPLGLHTKLRFGVSREPCGGSERPTGPMLISVDRPIVHQ